MSSKIDEARKEGYSDEEIFEHLSKKSEYSQKFKTAIDEGYKPAEILNHIESKNLGPFSKYYPSESPEHPLKTTIKEHPGKFAGAIGVGAAQLPFLESIIHAGGEPEVPIIGAPESMVTSEMLPVHRLMEKIKEGLTEDEKKVIENAEMLGEFLPLPEIIAGVVSKIPRLKNILPALKTEKIIPAPPLPPSTPWQTIEETMAGRKPPPPPTLPPAPAGISPGREVPARPDTYEEKERLVQKLTPEEQKEVIPERPLSPTERAFQNLQVSREGRPLANRARQEYRNIGLRPTPFRGEHPTHIEDQIGEVLSPNEFYNTRQGGLGTINEVRRLDREVYHNVNDLYAQSREINRTIESIHPQYVNELNNFVADLRQIPRHALSTPQRSLLTAINDIINRLAEFSPEGQIIGYRPINNQTLIDISQSLRSKIDHDFAHGDASNIFRPVINATMQAAERAAAEVPEALESLRNARNSYRDWVTRFDNPYVRPLRDQSNHDYSKMFRGFLDLDEFNYLRNILLASPQGRALERGIARELVEKRLSPILNKTEMNWHDYNKELRELESFITPQERNELERIAHGHETRRIRAGTQGIPKAIKVTAEKAEIPYKKPEDISRAFKSRSGIRELKARMAHAGESEAFDKLAIEEEQKLFKKKYGREKITGKDIIKVIDEDEDGIITELLGKETVDAMYKISSEVSSNEMTVSRIKKIWEKAFKHIISGTIIGKIAHIFL